MSRYRPQGVLAVGLGVLTSVACACSTPDLETNLRPEGDPEILAGMAHNGVDSSEVAFFCKYDGTTRDVKAPGFVGNPIDGGNIVCPEDKADYTAADIDPRAAESSNPATLSLD